MGNFQETLNSLKPYVVQIRYVSGVPVIDTVFKEGWILPESKIITKVKGDDSGLNYYMIYSQLDGIGVDEVIDYIRVVISVNMEREKKHMLLKEKIEELKNLFKKTPLAQLTKLRFILTDEMIQPKTEEIELHEIDMVEIEETPLPIQQQPVQQSIQPPMPLVEMDSEPEPVYIPEPQIPLPENLTEEELEILEEERRAENYKLYKQQNPQQPKQQGKVSKNTVRRHQRVELPPRQMAYASDCDCGENEACEKCIDAKGY